MSGIETPSGLGRERSGTESALSSLTAEGSIGGAFSTAEGVATWTAKNTRGPKVALVGRSVETVLVALVRESLAVTAYVSDPSSVDDWLASRAIDDRKAIELHCLSSLDVDERVVSANTVVVFGWSKEIDGSDGLLRCVQRRLSDGARLVLVVPDFSNECLGSDGFDISSFIEAARGLLSPVHLSFADDTLRFIGEFGAPGVDTWSEFELRVWPSLLRDGVRSVAVRNRREVAGLQQRLARLGGLASSIPYRVGTVAVLAAKRPVRVWRLAATLWRIHRSRWDRRAPEEVEPRQHVVFPRLPLPQPNASERPVVAAILDTFSDYCLRYELDLLRLTPAHWRREIEASPPAFLLVESAWAGHEGRWRGLIVHNQESELNPMSDLVSYCRGKGITTVFWNKEDPPNFDYFIGAARQFDIIFTSDADCVSSYRKICGHDRVYVMPFAAQPKIHNPSRKEGWPRYPVCFAGRWAGDEYEERTQSIPVLLDPALGFGLHIMDRNLGRANTRPNSRFPGRYQEAIKGSLAYQEMLTAYRCYDVMLNANSVTESPTMFSRRVFESLACATPVISLESAGMRAMLGEHVRIARTREETSAHLEALLGDDETRTREGHLAYRHVHEHHTYRHRVEMILEEVSGGEVSRPKSTVSLLGILRDPGRLESILVDYEVQSYREKQLLVVIANNDTDVEAVESRVREVGNAEVVHSGILTFGERVNRAVEEASGAYIAVFDDADEYCEHYIADMMMAADFSDAELLGKASYFSYDEIGDQVVLKNEGKDHTFVESVATSTLVARRDVMRDMPFAVEARGIDSLLTQATLKGFRVYSADRFNYLEVHSIDADGSRALPFRNDSSNLSGERKAIALGRVSL